MLVIIDLKWVAMAPFGPKLRENEVQGLNIILSMLIYLFSVILKLIFEELPWISGVGTKRQNLTLPKQCSHCRVPGGFSKGPLTPLPGQSQVRVCAKLL